MKRTGISRKITAAAMAAGVALSSLGMTGCGTETAEDQVIIYSNADEEAVTAMENALDSNGYEGQYVFQTFGTSELGGRLLAEGKDMDPVYEGMISVTDIASSSTAWLLVQALVSEYGVDGAQEVLEGIYKNAGDHLEDSGSAPLKLVRAGEVALGFGLRQQAVADKEDGLPIDFVDPAEGNFSLTESVAVIEKGDESNPLAMEMAQCIIENGREELQSYYPNALYSDETTDAADKSENPKVFPEKLTVDLLEQHEAISEAAKKEAGL